MIVIGVSVMLSTVLFQLVSFPSCVFRGKIVVKLIWYAILRLFPVTMGSLFSPHPQPKFSAN